jgi:hypothetical protein
MKVEIKSKTVENKNNKYTCILYIKNNDIEVKNWQITVSKKTNITWCDKLIINKNIIENNNVPLKSKETLIINYKGNGTIPKRFKFINKDINKESSNQINSITIDKNKIGVYEGFDYEFWKDKDGKGTMTLKGPGSFSCSWLNINNALFRIGKKLGKDNDKSYKKYENIKISYTFNIYQPFGNSYLAVYGWTTNPLVEYYIIDNWGSWRPPGNTISKGIIFVDDGIYEIYETTRTNQPSIIGEKTFKQYWSVRTAKRNRNGINNIVSVNEHFKEWEIKGMDMSGNLYEVSMVIEGYKSNGVAELSNVVVTL